MKKLLGALMLVGLLATNAMAWTVTLSWQDNSTDETGFTVQKRNRTGPNQDYADFASVGTDITTVQDTVVSGDRFCYRVRAFNQFGTSDYSNEACILANPGNVRITIGN